MAILVWMNVVMHRATLALIAAPAVVLAGCGHNPSRGASPDTSSSEASNTARITIDGQATMVQGTVSCTAQDGLMVIRVGNASNGLGATLSDNNPPAVQSVTLGSINGQVLTVSAATPDGWATAARDGKTFMITGRASGVGMANTVLPLRKPFEFDVTCP